jgi:membrane-associated PAP2 superfamily phosphatase
VSGLGSAGRRGGVAGGLPAPATWRHDLAVALAGLLLIALWEWSGWDLVLSQWVGGPAGFPWRGHVLTRRVLHDGGRWLAWGVAAWLAWDAWRPRRPGPSRGWRAFALAVVLGSTALVSALKRASTTSCPWDLEPFGGHAPYVPHWLWGLADGGPGHCFPSGHAVAAFGFFGVYFLWREHHPALARRALALTLAAGALFGAAQLARGAHFASHTLWSAWCCWALAASAFALAAGRRPAPQAVAA